MPTHAPIRLSVSEAAKFLGVSTRTIRRAVTAGLVTYIVVNERYKITLDSLLSFAESTTTVQKKLNTVGFGAFVEKWKLPKTNVKEIKTKGTV
ncbi:MAG: helix-turn-helix domain-containing protein [Patescibacteria group bacterium]